MSSRDDSITIGSVVATTEHRLWRNLPEGLNDLAAVLVASDDPAELPAAEELALMAARVHAMMWSRHDRIRAFMAARTAGGPRGE